MPSLTDSAFIFVLALLLFGPKKLPVLARELGKWIGEFRRASNEFKMQMEEELRIAERAEKDEKAAAIQAAAPPPPPLDVPAEPVAAETLAAEPAAAGEALEGVSLAVDEVPAPVEAAAAAEPVEAERAPQFPGYETIDPQPSPPMPIATSGEIRMMPPPTGLPLGRSYSTELGPLVDAIPIDPARQTVEAGSETAESTVAHGN